MNKPEPVECRTCKAKMYWVVTKNGKNMPVDAQPSPRGGLVITLKPDGKLYAEAFMPNDAAHAKRNRYVSHFSTCPQRDQHRK